MRMNASRAARWALYLVALGASAAVVRAFIPDTLAAQMSAPPVPRASGSFSATIATGCTTTPSFTVYWSRVGDVVTANLAGASCTSNSTALTLTGWPASLLPARRSFGVCVGQVNSGSVIPLGYLQLETSGTHSVARGDGSAWTASGNKQPGSCAIVYSLK